MTPDKDTLKMVRGKVKQMIENAEGDPDLGKRIRSLKSYILALRDVKDWLTKQLEQLEADHD